VNSPRKKEGMKKMLGDRKISTLFSSLKNKYKKRRMNISKLFPIKVYAIQCFGSVNMP